MSNQAIIRDSKLNQSRSNFSDSGNDSRTAEFLIQRVLEQAETDECELAYFTSCESESGRRTTGSYYTPADVAMFFWNQFFKCKGISDAKSATTFVLSHKFMEPSCGSGILVYALIRKLLQVGVALDTLRNMDILLIDINQTALDYIQQKFTYINSRLGGQYFNPVYQCIDFLSIEEEKSFRPVIVFGNPPFVANKKGSKWKNSYADFIDVTLDRIKLLAGINLIVPLSLSFSRDYSDLRKKLCSKKFLMYASHFDNIPDTLFKSGKPKSINTNKANSQRCSILSAFSAPRTSFFSSKLHRWNSINRDSVLGSLPEYEDVTNCRVSNQFIRPSSPNISRYLKCDHFKYSISDLCENNGAYQLHIGSVARNYISIRECAGKGVHSFFFNNIESFYRFFGIVSSDIFMDYWLSIGDGFHLTLSNISKFPVSHNLDDLLTNSLPEIKRIWKRRERYEKSKLNSGIVVKSYDFTMVAIKFNHVIFRSDTNS